MTQIKHLFYNISKLNNTPAHLKSSLKIDKAR